MLSKYEIAQMIDLSAVQPNATVEELHNVAKTAIEYNCICVFALPSLTPVLVDLLKDYPKILIGGVVGFPDGGATTAGKVAEAKELKEMGCNELDMVINIGKVRSGLWDEVKADIQAVKDEAGDTPLKVIFECHYLTDEEIVKACEVCCEVGVAWVKTGTGWAETGATLENTKIMKGTVGDRCPVKAAGGVRSLETLLAMYDIGVRRFGIGVRTAKAILDDQELGDDVKY